MSKIGRKPIDIKGVQVDLKGHSLHYKGQYGAGSHELPEVIDAHIEGDSLRLTSKSKGREVNRVWGLNRALLNNKISGAQKKFVYNMEIVGLGYKVKQTGNTLEFSLGYSHKIDFDLPKSVSFSSDKTGQIFSFESTDKELLGLVCAKIRALRKPEPYKGTGIKYKDEVLLRKAGKTKGS